MESSRHAPAITALGRQTDLHLFLHHNHRPNTSLPRLPGEAMQIDRVMDSFSAHYCAQNPNIFEERDTCFILSFSIIMLNTALHNPNAKMKITSEQFVKQNKGINSGKDLPNDMLEAIFSSIKEEPFKIPDETYDDLMYTFFSPEREGWLMKQVRLGQAPTCESELTAASSGRQLEELEASLVRPERPLPLLLPAHC